MVFDRWQARSRQIASAVGINADYFYRQIDCESGFNPKAYNKVSGATGIAQIIPRFHPNVDPWDPEQSLWYAANLMKHYLNVYDQDWPSALACYNWGSGNVMKAKRDLGDVWQQRLPEETRRYIRIVLQAPT